MTTTKLQISLKCISDATSTQGKCEVVLKPTDTVKDVKARVAASQLVVFPKQQLMLNGSALADDDSTALLGLKDSDVLELLMDANEQTIASQLADLVQTRGLSVDELGLLYCYKHGFSVQQALRAVGSDSTLHDFVQTQKEVTLEDGKVSAAAGVKVVPFCVKEQVTKILEEAPKRSMPVTELCAQFIKKFNVSLSSVVGMRPAQYLEKESGAFALEGGRVSIKKQSCDGSPKEETRAKLELVPEWRRESASDKEQDRVRTRELAARPAGKALTSKPVSYADAAKRPTYAEAAKRTAKSGTGSSSNGSDSDDQPNSDGFRSDADDVRATTPPPGFDGRDATPPPGYASDGRQQFLSRFPAPSDQMYVDLHDQISSRTFNSRVAQNLNAVVEFVKANVCVDFTHVIKGGAVGKGTAIAGCADGEVAVYLNVLPHDKLQKWVPGLLKSVAAMLDASLDTVAPMVGVTKVAAAGTAVQLTRPNMTVDFRFCPHIEPYEQVLDAMKSLAPADRKYLEPCFAREQVALVGKQPGQVKVTMRLLKWWREQQLWKSALNRPSDYLLELVCIHVHQQTRPSSQHQAVMGALNLLSRFDEMRIVWTNHYTKADIWAPLLLHRPLLLDPVNPFANVADPTVFDPTQMMTLASQSRFFW